jgi:putative transposase
MPTKQRSVTLTKGERKVLEAFVSHGKKSARAITRARILLLLDEGRKEQELTKLLGVSRGTVYNIGKKYQQKGHAAILDLLHDAPRSGRPITLDSRVEAKVTMIACSTPPTGRGRWTLQLIADKLVELAVTDSISHESVRRVLKKTNSNRG